MPTQPGSSPTSPERIERLQKRRTRIFTVQVLLFAIWQVDYFAITRGPASLTAALHTFRVSAYVVWVAALLMALATGGGFRYGREVRAILNDESTREHRRRAMEVGFWAAMTASLGCYLVNLFHPLGAGTVIHVILTFGVACAMLMFVALERRAQADG